MRIAPIARDLSLILLKSVAITILSIMKWPLIDYAFSYEDPDAMKTILVVILFSY